MRSQDELFAIRIRQYYYDRLGAQFLTNDYGFLCFTVKGDTLTIEELYTDAATPLIHTLSLVRRAIKIGKSSGCTLLIGGNETSLDSYEKIKKLHTWFGMVQVGNNGTLELWGKRI